MDFTILDKIKRFPGKGGWYYVAVPSQITDITSHLARRGLVPITAKLGSSVWSTSLLPKGDGTHFVALKSTIRKKEKIDLGDEIELNISINLL